MRTASAIGISSVLAARKKNNTATTATIHNATALADEVAGRRGIVMRCPRLVPNSTTLAVSSVDGFLRSRIPLWARRDPSRVDESQPGFGIEPAPKIPRGLR